MQALHVTSDMIGYIHTKRMYDKGGAMARNKYPQRTVEKILEVSLALFNEKGYEKTTIQDIVNFKCIDTGKYMNCNCKTA